MYTYIYIYPAVQYTTEQILSCLLYHKSRDKQGKTMRGYLMAAEVGTKRQKLNTELLTLNAMNETLNTKWNKQNAYN